MNQTISELQSGVRVDPSYLEGEKSPQEQVKDPVPKSNGPVFVQQSGNTALAEAGGPKKVAATDGLGRTAKVGEKVAYRRPPTIKYAVTIRGNGQKMPGSMYGLAQLYERFGFIDAKQGSSSGSVITFFDDSIAKNPSVFWKGDERLGPKDLGLRFSLLLKSLTGYAEYLSETSEGQAVWGIEHSVQQLKQAIEDGHIKGMLGAVKIPLFHFPKLLKAGKDLGTILKNSDLRELLGDEYMAQLGVTWPGRMQRRLGRMMSAAKPSIQAGNADMMFRPGILDIEQFIRLLDRPATFLATADFSEFLETFAERAEGKTWPEIKQLTAPDGRTAEDMLNALIAEVRPKVIEEGMSRLDDKVGDVLPVMVSTSAFVDESGDMVDRFKQTKKDYLAGKEYDPSSWKPEVGKFRIGYIGHPREVKRSVAYQKNNFSDAKSQLAYDIGQLSWADTLKASISEPGLAPAHAINDRVITNGGHLNNAGVRATRGMGAQHVFYVTRQGGESSFAQNVLKTQYDFDPALVDEIHGTDPGEGSALDMADADAAVVANWDNIRDPFELMRDGLSAPIYVNPDGGLADVADKDPHLKKKRYRMERSS